MPERPSASPILMLVSLRPSVCDQPDGHFDRSTENPSGPVSEAPSADTPHLLSLIRCTTAARSLAHSASQSSIDAGRAVVAEAAAEVLLDDPAAVVLVAPPATLDAVAASSPSSPPHAAAAPKVTP